MKSKKIIAILLIILAITSLATLASCEPEEPIDVFCTDGILTFDNLSDTVTSVKAFINGVEVFANLESKVIDIASYLENLTDNPSALTIKIEGYNKKDKLICSGEKTLSLLPRVNVEIKDGIYDWSTSAEIIRSAYPDTTIHFYTVLNSVLKDGGDATQVEIPAGESTFMVRPYIVGRKDVFGCYSERLTVRCLAVPQNVYYDGRYITWSKIDFPNMPIAYRLFLDDEEPIDCTANWYDLAQLPLYSNPTRMAKLNVKVRAISSDESYYISSAFSGTKIISQLDTIENVVFDHGDLCWDAVPGADCYYLKIDGMPFDEDVPVTDTRISLNIVPNSCITVKIKPAISAENALIISDWSESISSTFLTPPTLQYQSGLFYWRAVTDCAGYRLYQNKLDGDGKVIEEKSYVFDFAKDVISCNLGFEEIGSYQVYLIALAARSETYVDSMSSNVITVNKLSAPTGFTLRETMESIDLDYQTEGTYQMDINFDPIADNNAYYQLLLDGTSISGGSTDSHFSFVMNSNVSERDYTLEVTTKSFDESKAINNTLTLGSSNTLRIKLTKLGIPSNLGFSSPNGENLLVWDNDENASAYVIYANGKLTQTKSNKMSLASYSAGKYQARISSKGNMYEEKEYKFDVIEENNGDYVSKDTILLSSDFSNYWYFEKLATPTSLVVRDNGAYLTWDGINNGCIGYKIRVNVHQGGTENKTFYLQAEKGGTYSDIIESNSVDLLSLRYGDDHKQYTLSEYGTTYAIVAVGNRGVGIHAGQHVTIDSDYTETKVLFKLPKPTKLRANGNRLSWTDPANAGTNVRSYSVFDGSRLIGYTTSTEYNIENEALSGMKHYFNVVADGDNETYFQSDAVYLENGQTDENGRFIFKLNNISGATLEKVDRSYRWLPIEGAVEYYVIVSANTRKQYVIRPEEVQEDGYIYFEPDFENYSAPSVSITARGDNDTTIDSDSCTFIQEVGTLDTPQGNNLIQARMVGERIQLYSTLSERIGRGVVYYVDGIARDSDEDGISCTLAFDAIGSHLVRIAYGGNYFDENGKYWYTSSTSESYKTIKYFPPIADNKIRYQTGKSVGGSTEIIFTFPSMTGVTEYRYYYEITDRNGDYVYISQSIGKTNSSSASIVIENTYLNGNYDLNFHVLAVGDGISNFSCGTYVLHEFENVTR